jgi:hypothetical protein
MANNISKYVALNDFLLLEYEFNKAGQEIDLRPSGEDILCYLAETTSGTKQFFNIRSMGKPNKAPLYQTINNDLRMNSVPTSSNRSNWYVNPSDESSYFDYFDSSININNLGQTHYIFDTVKVHIVSGYNFDDIPGFLLQIGAKDSSGNMVDLSNLTWINQSLPGEKVLKFATNSLYLGNKFYDKYVEISVPSTQYLSRKSPAEPIEQLLNIADLSDIYFTYSTISELDNTNYVIQEKIVLQLPTASQADNFNAFIAESTDGDFIEFYATWKGIIIGEYMGDIESGRIPLYTSNNPNDNFEEFADQYGAETAKWVVMHEIYVTEHIPGADLLTQQYIFTQEDNFTIPNYFRPVIKNADIASSYSIRYICRLTNRMDGTQIIRQASFSSVDPKKYGRTLMRLNVDNFIPYKVFNRVEGEASTTVSVNDNRKSKFVKVYYDSTNILLNMNNEIVPQGTGPLFLKRGDGTYKFSFDRINNNAGGEYQNVDLSGVYNYGLLFILDDDTKIEIPPTYSTNMNTTLGELEFKLMGDQIDTLLKQSNNTYSIIIKNPDGSKYTFYEGVYFPYSNYEQVIANYQSLFDVTEMQAEISRLESEIRTLKSGSSS